MANKLRGFARMLSTAKDSTRKDVFSSTAKTGIKNPKDDAPVDYVSERMKEIYGDIDYRTLTYAERKKILTRLANRRVDIEALKILSISAAIGLTGYGYSKLGWYPFEKEQEEPQSSSPSQQR